MIECTFSNSTILAVGVVAFSITYVAWKRIKRSLENKLPFDGAIPTLPNNHWLTGHISSFRGRTLEESQRLAAVEHANEYGQTSWWALHAKTLCVTDIEDVKLLLHTSPTNQSIWIFRHHVEQWLGPRNIGMLRGKEWKFHRSAILRAFSPSVTAASQPSITYVADTFVRSIQRRNEETKEANLDFEDIGPLMKMITMDVFGLTSLSQDLMCCKRLEPSPVAHAFDFTGQSLRTRFYAPFLPWKQFYWIPSRENIEFKRQRAILRGFIEDTINERRKLLVANETSDAVKPPNDLLTAVLKATEDSSDGDDDLSTQTFRDLMMSLLFAGYDTTSITMTYALYNVASHATVETECIKEIKRFWRGPNTNVEDLVYCKSVILETLRLFPPAVSLVRSISKDTKLKGGFVVPVGTNLYVPVFMIQRMEAYYPQPEKFLPERWAYKHMDDTWVERSEGSMDRTGDIPPGRRDAFLAFSTGARSCAGQRFAMNESILILARLLKDIKFVVKDGYKPVPVRVGIVQEPKDGMPMKLVLRNLSC